MIERGKIQYILQMFSSAEEALAWAVARRPQARPDLEKELAIWPMSEWPEEEVEAMMASILGHNLIVG